MIQQRSPEWYEQRLGKVTASEIKKVMMAKTTAGYKDYRAQKVLERILGIVDESYTSSDMQWGIDNEDLARVEYMLMTGNVVVESEFADHPTVPMSGASPDGEIVRQNGGVEIKCPKSATHMETLEKKRLPSQYKAQVQWQMACKGWDFVDFVSYDPRMPIGSQIIIIRVERDNEYIDELEKAVIAFNADVDELENFIRNYGKANV